MSHHPEPPERLGGGSAFLADELSRRTLLRRAAVAGMALSSGSLLAACGGGDDTSSGGRTVAGIPGEITSDTVVYADYGGTTRAAMQSVFYDSFHDATGVKVVNADADDAQFLLMARRGRSQWDGMLQVPGTASLWAQQGLLQKLPSWIPRSDFDQDRTMRDYLAGGFYAAWALGYLNSAYQTAKPESWADFFDTKRFPGKRVLWNNPDANFEAALLADGVPPEQLVPLDFDRAIAKLDSIRGDLLFGDSPSAVQQLLATGTATMTVMLTGRLVPLISAGTDLGICWNQAIVQGDTGPIVPRGAEHSDTMHALIYWMTDPARQAAFTRITGYGPTNAKAFELLDDDTIAMLPNSPEHLKLGVRYDFLERAKQQPEYVKRWTKWLAG
jgi:putative spermidine/putrescine transport system substrate-binding protein